jgi:nucleotide sugar dehydrogenase
MIGIIGHGMVGSAIAYAFSKTAQIISDPAINSTTIADVCQAKPEAIFVCVPTPTDDTDYALLKGVLSDIKATGYTGLTVVKSTVLPHHLEGFDVLYNPEFLSRATAIDDFVNPVYVVIGGDRGQELLDIYRKYSTVDTSNTYLVDIPTAALIKYTMNTFFAVKVTFANQIYDVANQIGADYNKLKSVVRQHPWVGSYHFDVPGNDDMRGFGGPCLPKDTAAMAKEFNLELLNTVLDLNNQYRK